MGKNHRLLEDARVHLFAYLQFYLGRSTLCLDYLSLDEGIEKVVEFMDAYFISQENFDSLMLMSKFQVFCFITTGACDICGSIR
ncbi:unnamed protein product [Lactuca virosa]|uniref:DNA replication factor RFC1 C-terminal domain-containing protein n=1 Tax=Lactuca virosa TaxID=75947 RepID=A0AAU9PJ20_9ASTR|nr:unnamed protein product [Lactuca virosa]